MKQIEELFKVKEDGLHTEWYENGKKKSEWTYKDGEKDGKRDGLFTDWYENGQKEKEGNLEGGKEVGKWTYYNGDGTIEKIKEF